MNILDTYSKVIHNIPEEVPNYLSTQNFFLGLEYSLWPLIHREKIYHVELGY